MNIRADLRVELMAIVYHLANNPEYEAFDTPYRRAVEHWFEGFRSHPVVTAARELRTTHSISYNAPMSLAVFLDPETLLPIVALGQATELDERWAGVPIAAFLEHLRDFAVASRASVFFAGQTGYMRAVTERLTAAVLETKIEEWYANFFASAAEAEFVVVPGLLTGHWNYEASSHDATGRRTAYQIVELERADPNGLPTPGYATNELVAHEMGHAFINPIVVRANDELTAAAQPLFDREREAMVRNRYMTVTQFVEEMLVRAVTALFTRDRFGKEVASQLVRTDLDQGFGWNVQLAIWLDGQPRPVDLTTLATKAAQWLREEAPKFPPATAAKPT